MNRQYYNLYRAKTLNHIHLKQKILELFTQDPSTLPMNLDQILYCLDLKCEDRKADRDISVELFNQSANNIHKVTLEALVTNYIQNLQTSQLCLKRDQMRLDQLLKKTQKVETREKSFIFLKLIQVSIYSKFTRQSVIEYKIVPTDIPPVTLANAINPVLNHQFILQMEQPEFDLVFEESGIQIFRWTFPDQPDLLEGQYERVITSENITFQVKIKYLPQGNRKGKQTLLAQIQKLKNQIDRQRAVFKKLCNFEPFLQKKVISIFQQQQDQGEFNTLLKCFPFLKKHLRFSFWLTNILIVLQCWSASIWPMQFLDIILCIYLIGIFLDLQIKDYSMRLLILQLSLALLSLKSVLSLVTQPFFNKTQTNKYSIIICIAFKILLIFALSIVRGRQLEIQNQKIEFIYGHSKQKQKIEQNEVSNKIQLNIWDEL